ncbi:MAG: methyltransferase domain-containing protein [Candidatus Limnocylindria bacterium]
MTGTTDPFASSDRLEEAQLEAIVTRLEARATHPAFVRMMDEYLDAMQVDAVASVIDLGSGTGVVARAIARRPAFAGRVVGVDLSSYLVATAERLAQEEGLGDRLEFRTGDSTQLNMPDGSFDAAVAHTLLSHVTDPAAVIREAVRVVRPGGTFGFFDGDYASLTFGHRDPDTARAFDEAIIAAWVASPRVMRQMPRLLAAAGLELVATFADVLSEVGTADYWRSGIQMYRRLLPATGAFTEAEANAWASDQMADSDAGIFFGASNFYAYVARRP